jgi:hypothetical protein
VRARQCGEARCSSKSLRKHFALEIGIGAAEANFLVGRLFPRDDSTEERGSLREGVAALDAKR